MVSILGWRFVGWWLVLLLAGCASAPRQDAPRALVLNGPVSVPEGRARVFFQHGQLVPGVDEFAPHCALEIDRVSGLPRTVPAGRYLIERVQDVTTEVVFGGFGHQVAGVGVGIGINIGVGSIGWGGRDALSDIFEGYHFWLTDSARVGLMRLTCLGARDQPADVMPPTRKDMAQALGKWGRLE